ncbi:hypothetical protein uan_015 [Pseudomonas phage UAntarctica]|nr:hypothetical protein uan_015 [Pseudomonas phage UAntarctica]
MGTAHRVIETPVFKFDQLSDKAKEKAREWWRGCEATDMTWERERRESLEAFCNEFPVQAKDWEYDAWTAQITARFTGEDDLGTISGSRLVAYLRNNHEPVLTQPRKYGKRTSKTLREISSCPFTGYCMDENLLDPIREFLVKPGTWCLSDLLEECLDRWVKAAREDVKWINEDEQVDETILSNEYEFDVSGSIV